MALTIGMIGLPQSGKTSLFNAITRAGAPVSGYATSTVQANFAVVQVPDARLQPLADIFHPKRPRMPPLNLWTWRALGRPRMEMARNARD